MLRDETDPEKAAKINDLLSENLSGVDGGFDLQLFQMEKDRLLFNCKYLLAMFDFDSAKMELYAGKIKYLSEQIEKKKLKAKLLFYQ